MTKFAYGFSIAAMTLTALFLNPHPALAGEAAISAVSSKAAPSIEVGRMLYAAGGKRLAAIYKVKADGSPQIILDGKLVTIPAATVASADGKLVTSLSKVDLTAR